MEKVKKHLLDIFPYIGILAFIIDSLVFVSGNRFIGVDTNTAHWFSLNAVNLVLQICGLTIPVLLGALIFRLSKSVKVILTIFWVSVVTIGCVLLIGRLLVTDNIPAVQTIYGVLLPISRNAIPLITGIFLGILFQNYTSKLLKDLSQSKALLFIIVLTGMPTIFNVDVFGLGNGNNTLTYALLYTVGVWLTVHNEKSANTGRLLFKFVLQLIFALLLLAGMSWISMSLGKGHETALRFVEPSSVFVILPVITLSKLMIGKITTTEVKGKTLRQISVFVGASVLSILALQSPIVLDVLTPQMNDFLKAITVSRLLSVFALSLGLLVIFLLLSILCVTVDEKWIHLNSRLELKIARLPQTAKSLKKSIADNYQLILLFLVSYLVAYFGLAASNATWKIGAAFTNGAGVMNAFAYYFLERQNIILVTTGIILIVYLLLKAITNNFWVSFIITELLSLTFSIASFIKLSLRSEPIYPNEISAVNTYIPLLKMMSKTVIFSAVVGVIVVVLLIIFCSRKFGTKVGWSGRRRILVGIFTIVAMMTTNVLNHPNTFGYKIWSSLGVIRVFYAQQEGAMANGAIIQTLNNIDIQIMSKPSGYSRSSIAKISQKYAKEAKKINERRQNSIKDQTVMFVLSESFSDPARVPKLSVNKTPINNILATKKENTSGLMMSSGYGGGTANMEYQSLTSLSMGNFSATMSTPYTQLIPKKKAMPSIANDFSHSATIHPFAAYFYNRPQAYQVLGIKQFKYLGSKYPITDQKRIGTNPYLSDKTAYHNAVQQLKKYKTGQFVNLITMQNHMPFYNYYKHDDYSVNGKAYKTESSKQEIENYSEGIHYTDTVVPSFLKDLDKIQKPITVVWYGDHLPALYDGLSMQKYGIKLHQTDYFVYSNAYARRHGATKKIRTATSIVDPTNFAALAMKQSKTKVSAFYALQTQLLNDFPAMSINGRVQAAETSAKQGNKNKATLMMSPNKEISTGQLSARQKRLLHDYRLVQYDITAGKQYYKATKLMAQP